MLPLLLLPALVVAAPAKPGWLTTTPEFPGRVYGVGVAPANNTRALAIHQATDNAKAKVLERLRANVQADTTIATAYQEEKAIAGKTQTESASRTTNRKSKVQVQTRATDLPGLTVETTYLDEDSANPTMYALAYLDMGVATREVQARFDAVAATLGADPGDDLRAKLHRTRVLKLALGDLGQLEDLFGLIRAGGADPALGDAITKARLKAEREREALRRAVTFGMPANQDVPVDADVKGAVRTAFLQEGLGWSDQNPDLAVTLRVRSGRNGVQAGSKWWDYNRTPDFIVAQGTISLTLVDTKGQEYESTLVEAKGVGTTEFQAETLLLKDYKNKLTKTVGAWLNDLGK
jgi:hypothetical protein